MGGGGGERRRRDHQINVAMSECYRTSAGYFCIYSQPFVQCIIYICSIMC